MRKTFLFSILILLLAGCSKSKFTTAPQLTYKSVNTTILSRNEDLIFTLHFTDAEGDVTGPLTTEKVVRLCPNGDDGGFVQPYDLPTFPAGKDLQGDIIVTFNYNDVSPKCFPKNDTAVFKFVLKDKAQHVSDTAVSEPIVIINN